MSNLRPLDNVWDYFKTTVIIWSHGYICDLLKYQNSYDNKITIYSVIKKQQMW